jgi:hypothetical protein
MKKFLAALLSLTFILGGSTAVDAAVESVGDPGRAWSVPNNGELGMHVMQFIDTFAGEPGTFLLPKNGVQTYNDTDPTCASLTDAKCSSGNVYYQAVLPFCNNAQEIYCTSDVGIVDAAGKKTSAIFNRYFPEKAQNQYQGDSPKNLPSGFAGSLFSLPQAPHDGGDLYYLSTMMTGGSDGRQLNLQGFSVKLYPVKLETNRGLCGVTNCNDTGWGLVKAGDRGNPTGKDAWQRSAPGFSGGNFCVAGSAKELLCAQRYAFPAGIRFYVTVKTRQLPTGWLHGRLVEPDINISTVNDISTIEIQGNPMAVPVVYKMYRYPDLPDALKSQYDVSTGAYKNDPNFLRNPTGFFQGGHTAHNPDPMLRSVVYAPTASSPEGMEQLKLWLPYVEDKATALLSYWSARSLEGYEMEGANNCFRDSKSVTGIVTTNSTQYSAGPPKFDKAEGTLNYQVAAPHYATDKSEFKGTYDLVIRSDVARCIYGFSKAPINATISITSTDGTPQIATTVIGEKDGWVYLRAKNFGFSSPVIKAKLSQEAEVVATPAPSATPTPSASAKPVVKTVTITCIKGKTSKKVTAVNPMCPAGYKKK